MAATGKWTEPGVPHKGWRGTEKFPIKLNTENNIRQESLSETLRNAPREQQRCAAPKCLRDIIKPLILLSASLRNSLRNSPKGYLGLGSERLPL